MTDHEDRKPGFVRVPAGTDWTCHSCGSRPAAWRSEQWDWAPDPFLVRPVHTMPSDHRPELHVILSTHEPIVPLLCQQCFDELLAMVETLEPKASPPKSRKRSRPPK
jgi:hypothetical protein